MTPVGKRGEEGGVFRIKVKAEPCELQLSNDFRLKQAAQIRERRDFVPGPDFFGHRRAADNLATFEDRDLESRPRKIRRCYKSIVTRANYYRVVPIRHHFSLCARIQSSS